MPDGDTDGGEIIVNGTPIPREEPPMFYWDWGWTGSLPYLFPAGGSGGGGGGGGGGGSDEPPPTDDPHDIIVTATATTPVIEIHGVTSAQQVKVLTFLAQMHHDPRVAAAMQEMHDKHVTLSISFVDTLPPVDGHPGDPRDRAQVHFTPITTGFESNSPREFMPGSTVYIEIDRDMISNLTWEDTLEGILSHEFTHLIRDANGQFLNDLYNGGTPGHSTQDADNSVYQHIYGFDPDGGSAGSGQNPPAPSPPTGGGSGGPGNWFDEPPINSVAHTNPGADHLDPIIWGGSFHEAVTV